MPRRLNQTSKTNPEAQNYQHLYHEAESNPDSFAKIVIEEFEYKKLESDSITQEINAIETAFNPDESRLIITSFLNNPYIFSDRVSLPLFKTCLDKVCLPIKKIDQDELIKTLMICKSKLFGAVMNDHENIPQFKEIMIYFLEKTKALMDGSKNDFSRLKYEIFDLLKLPNLDDEVKDAIIKSLNLRSKALISVVKGDNKDLISKIYESPESLNDKDQLNNGALHYACCLGNVDAIMMLQGIAEINSEKNFFNHLPLNLFSSDLREEKKKLLIFGNGLRDMQPPQKFIHTFKNLSDVGKKQLFSSFLKHKKFPNSDLESENEGLQDFFTTFRQDEEAFQKLADLIREKPENQEFITLINGSDLFDQHFKDGLKFKSKTLAERLIDSFESKDNDDDKKRFLTDILNKKNPESLVSENQFLKDNDVYDFFKIFLKDKGKQNLFDEFKNKDKEFSALREQQIELIVKIKDELYYENFITFLNIFSSDFHPTSEEIKLQVEKYVPDFKANSNLAFNKAFDMPENRLALRNLYLNYPEETKEIFTPEKLTILLESDLEVKQKQKLLIKVLEMDFNESEKLSLIKSTLKSTWENNKRFFPNQESDEARELLEKLNAQQIKEILLESLFEKINPLNARYNHNKNADDKYFIRFLFESPRFNYEERSNFLDRSFQKDSNGIRSAIKSDNNSSNNIIKNLSINLIQLELTDNVFGCSPELKAKLLSTALDSENITKVEKINLLTVLLEMNAEEKSNLIYDYFSSKKLISTQELLTQEVVGALFASVLDQEKKLNLAKKILGDDGLDDKFKKNFNDYLPEEFRSALYQDSEYVKSEVELALSGVINELKTQIRNDFSVIRVEKSRSSSPNLTHLQDSSFHVEVASNESSSSNSELSASTSEFSVIRTDKRDSKSPSFIEISSGDSTSSDEQKNSAGSASPVGQEAPNSPSIISATIGMGSPEPQTLSAISIVDNVLSVEDCEQLQKILKGRVSEGFVDVRSYKNPEEFIPNSPLRIFHVNYKRDNPFGNDGIKSPVAVLKERFHEENFDPLLKKIHESNNTFEEKKLKSYLYAILAISSGESDSISSFYEYYDNLIKKNRGARTFGPGHGSWIESPEHFVKLKIIINKMNEIHDKSVAEGNPAFTEKNLHQWMIAQVQDRGIEEFKFLNNKEFVDNLIDAFDCSTLDAKTSELKIVKESFQEFLDQNTNFLNNLATFSASEDGDNKGLANHLLDHLFKNMSSKNSSLSSIAKDTHGQQLEDLRENLTQKIDTFRAKLLSGNL
jgi:hypothetical protein